MATKKYILKQYYDLTTTVMIGEKQVVIRFTGGSRHTQTRGFYISSDERIQKALEKSPSYGRVYVEDKTYNIVRPKAAPAPVVTTPEDVLRDPETATRDTTVTSKAKAIAFIQGMFDASFVSNEIPRMKLEAAQRWNVLFTAWN